MLFRSNVREQNLSKDVLSSLHQELLAEHREDWLAALEILELVAEDSGYINLAAAVRAHLLQQKEKYPQFKKLIEDGLSIIDAKLLFE